MENLLQTILNKLTGIENRLKVLETGSHTVSTVSSQPKILPEEKKDELLGRAWDIISKTKDEEVSSDFLAKALNIDEKRAEKIFDQLEAEGYGSCQWKEVN